MRRQSRFVILLAVAIACVACGPTESLDVIADEYVQLTLAIGRHDPSYVDAYYGPEEWKRQAESGEPVPLPDLLDFARELLARVESSERSDRSEFLGKQLLAAEVWLRRASGESITLADEVRSLYDIELPSHGTEGFTAARERLEQLVPGDGDLQTRVEAFRNKFIVPPHRLNDLARTALSETRDRTIGFIDLPAGEAVRLSFVHDKPWGAYNWYQGGLTSQIEVNTDLPIELASLFATLAHESYPGHHTYNALLEDRLVRGQGWNEFSIYPLYSPQSLIAEGTADSGLAVVMDDNERWKFIEERLAPLAGIEKANFPVYRAVLEALRALKPVRGEAARMLLEDGADEDEVVAFLMEYGLESEGRARKTVEFVRAYRGYTYTYFVGEEMVLNHIGDGPDRPQRYFDLLQEPVTPSQLK